jgi:hypothetical protein
MLAQTIDSTGIVFSKTEKGREEMVKRSHGLSLAQRRILILIDGSKPADVLADMNPALAASGQFDEILTHLRAHGFIITAADKNTRPPSASAGMPSASSGAPLTPDTTSSVADWTLPAADKAPSEDDTAALRLIKDFMTTTAQTYLGLLSAPIIQRIEQARTVSQLKSMVGQWNMALRDSVQGRRFADSYLQHVKSALETGVMPALEIDA